MENEFQRRNVPERLFRHGNILDQRNCYNGIAIQQEIFNNLGFESAAEVMNFGDSCSLMRMKVATRPPPALAAARGIL